VPEHLPPRVLAAILTYLSPPPRTAAHCRLCMFTVEKVSPFLLHLPEDVKPDELFNCIAQVTVHYIVIAERRRTVYCTNESM
jgi:hypothetical protein